MILTKEQAAACYRAMCELNNVGMTLKACLATFDPLTFVNVFEWDLANIYRGKVRVVIVKSGNMDGCEDYASQSDFAKAYGVL